MATEYKLELQPKQRQAYDALENPDLHVIGYGGSKGGAKSHILREAMVIRRYKYPKTRGLIFRRTYQELNENHILRIFESYPHLRKYYNKLERLITFPNGSTLRFGYGEYDADMEQYNGKEYGDVFVDQAEQLSVYQIGMLKASNRATGFSTKFFVTFNPGGQGHDFLKSKFVDRQLTAAEESEGWLFIQSHAWDNVEWSVDPLIRDGHTKADYYGWSEEVRKAYFLKNSDYARTLQGLPDENMVAAYLWGDWNVFSGQFFSMLRKDVHMLPDDWYVDPGWRRHGTIDYGATTVFYTGVADYKNNIIIDHEVYTEDMPPSERAEIIAEKLLKEKIYNLLIYADTDMFGDYSNYTGMDKSPADIFEGVFKQMMGINRPTLIPISKRGENQRKYRIICNEAVKEYLRWKRGEDGRFIVSPHLFIKDRCKMFWETVPVLMYDPANPLDIDPKVGKDHCYDAAKYLVMSLYKPVAQAKEIKYSDDPVAFLMDKYLIPQQKRLGYTPADKAVVSTDVKPRKSYMYY